MNVETPEYYDDFEPLAKRRRSYYSTIGGGASLSGGSRLGGGRRTLEPSTESEYPFSHEQSGITCDDVAKLVGRLMQRFLVSKWMF